MIAYLNILLFLIAITGSIFFVSDYFVEKYCTIQSLWLLFVLLLNVFILYLRRSVVKCVDIFFLFILLLILCGGIIDHFSELFYGVIIILLSGNIVISLKKKNSLNVFFIYSGLSIIGFAEALLGILQYFYILPTYSVEYKMTGSFDNPAGFAVCLSVLSPFSLFLLRSIFHPWRIAGYSFFIISSCAIFLSESRTGILALMGVLIVHFYIFYLHQKVIRWNKGLFACAVILFLITLFVGLYFLKKDSADGRLLIWRVGWEMIKDSPLIGHGVGAFQAKYMLYQAEYFHLNPDSQFSQLADNVYYPFNEFLKIAVEYGGLGLVVLLLLIIWGISIYKKNSNPIKYPAFECIIAITICACFSYPLKYSMTWGLLGFALSIIGIEHHSNLKFGTSYIRWFAVGGALYLMLLLLQYTIAEMKWKKVVDRSLRGETEQMLPFYEELKEELGVNSLFLYNYAAELHFVGHYDESIEVLTECIRYWNDYDIQLLFADCYLQKGEIEKAEECLILASNMCPNRFIPLYQLVHLYDKIGEKEKAYEFANRITHKTIKVPSFKIQCIINEMKEYVDKGI